MTSTLDKQGVYLGAEYIVVTTSTHYDEVTNYSNTSTVEAVIEDVMEIILDGYVAWKTGFL